MPGGCAGIDGLAGLRVGWRGERIGLFAKARPGFSRLIDQGVECGGDVCALILLARPEYRTEFAFDAGGILEVYPTAGTLLRVDVGDVMIRHRGFAPPCSDCTTHNLTTRVGVGHHCPSLGGGSGIPPRSPARAR